MTISLAYLGVTVNLTDNNTGVAFVLNNPFFTIPTPVKDGTSNEIIIDMSMLTIQFMVTFDLKDGIGAGSKCTQLVTMARSGVANPKSAMTFVWDDFALAPGVPLLVKIAALRFGTEPGKKDFMPGCSMTLQQAKQI